MVVAASNFYDTHPRIPAFKEGSYLSEKLERKTGMEKVK